MKRVEEIGCTVCGGGDDPAVLICSDCFTGSNRLEVRKARGAEAPRPEGRDSGPPRKTPQEALKNQGVTKRVSRTARRGGRPKKHTDQKARWRENKRAKRGVKR